MSGKIITTSLKKKITNNWSAYFSEMGIYKPMWLMNVCGPLAVGIALLVKSDKTVYEPLMHIHNLCIPDDEVSLNLPIESGLIYIKSDDEEEYIKAIHNLRRNTYIPFEGDVDFNQLIVNMKQHYRTTLYKANLLKILLCLAIWSGCNEIYEDIRAFVDSEIDSTPELFGNPIIKKEFIKTLPINLDECTSMRKRVEQQKKELCLMNLPQRQLIVHTKK